MRVVVGIDGSDLSSQTLKVASTEAALRGLPLHIVHSWNLPLPPAALGGIAPTDTAPLEAAARSILDHAVAKVRATNPDLEVVGHLVLGAPAPALITAAEDAALVVLGSRGLGALGRLLLGSTGLAVAQHASCPVILVRDDGPVDPGPDAGRIVVGVDGSEISMRAVQFAFEAASRHRVGLTAVHVWEMPLSEVSLAGSGQPIFDPEDLEQDALRDLSESLAGEREQFPDVEVRQVVVRGPAAAVLADRSQGAVLTVVGSHGRGGFAGMLLGSTSQGLLHRSHGPVAVVRG